jgi:hypothetical protein
LDQAVRERGFAMVDVGDHGEIPDAFNRRRRHVAALSIA